jgi:hypothetical protein
LWTLLAARFAGFVLKYDERIEREIGHRRRGHGVNAP